MPRAFEGAFTFSSAAVQLSPIKSFKRFLVMNRFIEGISAMSSTAIDKEHFKVKRNEQILEEQ